MDNTLTHQDVQLNMIIVLFDQGGRNNPSFHVITKITPQFVYIRRLGYTSVDKHPPKEEDIILLPSGDKICKYRSCTEYIEIPTTEEFGVPVKRKINGLYKSNIYDSNKEYINYWYD